jgi:DNA-binding GntR family transcriptional regulator
MTKTDAAYLAIRSAIENGELAPGERLPVAALEQRLHMSPTPIREALRLLQADRLVQHQSHRGMVVTVYEPEDVMQIYELRALLEPLATARATERATEAELQEVRQIHDKHRKAVNRAAPRPDAAALNMAWHEAIYRASHSRYLQDFIARLSAGAPVPAMWRSAHAVESAREHEGIMEAIEARDAALAAERMRNHILGGAIMHEGESR